MSAAEDADDYKGPLINKGSLNDLFLQMKQELEGISPFPTAFTRTDYLLHLCASTTARAGPAALKKLAARAWAECEWFMVPLDHLSLAHYARFVYTFVNLVYNPEAQVNISQPGEDSDTAVVCTSSVPYMNKCFAWLHAHSIKLTQFALKIAPHWDSNADTALRVVSQVCSREREIYSKDMEKSIADAAGRQLPADASAHDKSMGHHVTTMIYVSKLRALIKGSPKALKKAAVAAGISEFSMLMLSLEFDDLFVTTQQQEAVAEATRQVRLKEAADAVAATAAAAAAAVPVAEALPPLEDSSDDEAPAAQQ